MFSIYFRLNRHKLREPTVKKKEKKKKEIANCACNEIEIINKQTKKKPEKRDAVRTRFQAQRSPFNCLYILFETYPETPG